ncbi:hypothetical protein EV561_101683 [Rhizobium sp. BK376]|nr:hypothetical protein EV561_101683 [Rhizobium sp. BK376]
MGLMVRRDIDITVICENLGPETRAAFAQIAARLMLMDSHVVSVRFRNDTGRWNKEPASYPDGLYLGLNVRTEEGADWTVDIWAVDQPERQPDLLHLRTLLPRITDKHRRIILTIKRELAARSDKIPSAHVYEAVVDGGVDSVDQFEMWLSTRKG